MSKKIVNEEVRPITLTDNDNGDKFVLEFSRESVKFAEARGFDIDDVGRFPMTKIPELFYYSFRKNHKNVSREKTDRILFEDLGGLPDGMLERLIMLYSEPFNVLTSSEEDGAEGKKSKMTVEL